LDVSLGISGSLESPTRCLRGNRIEGRKSKDRDGDDGDLTGCNLTGCNLTANRETNGFVPIEDCKIAPCVGHQ
jgi:hypothetical protein